MIVQGLILLLLVSVVPSYSLICYECGCDHNNISACDCGTTSTQLDGYYCLISEQRFIDKTYIQLSRVPRNATLNYVEDPYYILLQESIRYNQTSSEWYLWTSGAVFGCDWDLCNSPNLINRLPVSFNFSIDKDWLDTNIYGTGSVTECHHCPFEMCGDSENPIDFTQCPMTPCVNSSTCLVYDLWDDFETGDQCYQSQCAPEYLDGEVAQLFGGKYRIDVEAIVYLAQDRSKYYIWEIDVYCGAYNCTRPTIFSEIANRLDYTISDLSMYPLLRPTIIPPPPTTTIPITNPLICYSCECTGTLGCPCSLTEVVSLDDTYCIIARENRGQDITIKLTYLDYYASYNYILDAPFVIVEETISYDEKGVRWITTTNLVLYGCNWNLCNKPELIPLLPNTFQMRLSEAWLNTNILGTGQPVRDCHECPDAAQCGTTDFLDASRCPIHSCNTTCRVSDTFNDPAFDLLCYQSFCISPNDDQYNINHHRVEIEGLAYASEPNSVKIWEIDLYCRADDCSRPEVFKELREQLSIVPGNLAALFNETHDPTITQRRCYDCFCLNEVNCKCDRTTIKIANTTYCLLMREINGQDNLIIMGHLDQNSTRVYIRDLPYILIEESIFYNERTGRWDRLTNFAVYGCDWDLCNHPRLIQSLPNTFEIRLPEAWLNTSILGTGQPVRDCHECRDAPQCGTTDFLDASRCPIHSCNSTCFVLDTFDDPTTGELCYQSYCAHPDDEGYHIDQYQVDIEGILYLNKQPRGVELWEVDIYCRADDCSRPEIFQELKSQLTVTVGDLSAFDEVLPTTAQPTMTQPVTTNPPTATNSRVTVSTTSNASIFTSINLRSLLLVSILLFNFH
ncbi:unnamed protein product [Rotaria sp. Silwood2]|nr:unnamed protein product [Rotaria sp. Silwood2]